MAQAVADEMRREDIVLEAGGGRHVIRAEVADTEAVRQRGLMFRRTLGDDEGMLFVYGEAREITLWMRNTYLSLDMVFIGTDGRIHRIATDAEPFSEEVISSKGVVAGVLEVKAGTAARLGLKPGDRVEAPALDKLIAP